LFLFFLHPYFSLSALPIPPIEPLIEKKNAPNCICYFIRNKEPTFELWKIDELEKLDLNKVVT